MGQNSKLDGPSRSEAIRRLLNLALKTAEPDPRRLKACLMALKVAYGMNHVKRNQS